jgi:hypothetical protein
MSKISDRIARAAEHPLPLPGIPGLAKSALPTKPASSVARISISLPEDELKAVETIRLEGLSRKVPNQSEVVRAGLAALVQLDRAERARILNSIIGK